MCERREKENPRGLYYPDHPQVRVLAEDGGSPALSSTRVLHVRIRRNLHGPRWLQRESRVTVDAAADTDIGSLVSDADRQLRSPTLQHLVIALIRCLKTACTDLVGFLAAQLTDLKTDRVVKRTIIFK